MRIAAFPAGDFQTNCYIVSADNESECIIIDPGQRSYKKVCEIVRDNGLQPQGIFLTHGHADHVWDAPQLEQEFLVPVTVHSADRLIVEDPAAGVGPKLAQLLPLLQWKPPTTVVDYPSPEFTLGALNIRVLPLPGHTPGGVGLLVDDGGETVVLFSGDTLFKGAVGRTDLPGGNAQQLIDSIGRELIPLPDDVVVAPGHGETSTMGYERKNNIYLSRFR